MTTWHYTNGPGGSVSVSFPNQLGGQDALLGPGQTLTFNAAGSDQVTVYAATDGAVSRRGKVREVAQAGDGG